MSFQDELSFFCDIFRKNHVRVSLVPKRNWNTEQLQKIFASNPSGGVPLLGLRDTMKERTLYRLTDTLDCSYRLFLLQGAEEPTVVIVGPFLSRMPTERKIRDIEEIHRMPQEERARLSEFYRGLNVLAEDSVLLMVLNTFCERMWDNESFAIRELNGNGDALISDVPFSRSMLDVQPQETLMSAKTVEHRYEFENEMIRAVSLGQLHMEVRFRQAFSEDFFEKRTQDSLRNAKNYGVIMNTLMRKAAESGGVHPIYLDRVSSDFATRIEKATALSESVSLMFEMFRTYCRLVRQHSSQRYSALVQKAVLIIEADLSAELSLRILSDNLEVSEGYLSTVFRKETGKTVCGYIREKRMEYAEYLLANGDLQVQAVALRCGIMDVQYFTKLFKKQYGKTPTEFRLLLKSQRKKS